MIPILNNQAEPPFRPQPLAALRARLPLALAAQYLIEGHALSLEEREKQAFDFEDGLRLAVLFTFVQAAGPPGRQPGFHHSVRHVAMVAEPMVPERAGETLLLARLQAMPRDDCAGYLVPTAVSSLRALCQMTFSVIVAPGPQGQIELIGPLRSEFVPRYLQAHPGVIIPGYTPPADDPLPGAGGQIITP